MDLARQAHQRINQDHVPTTLERGRQSQQVGAAHDHLDIRRQARIDGEPLGEHQADGIVAGELAAQPDHEARLHAGASGCAAVAGKRTVKVVPPPGLLCTWIVPPCRVTMP